MRSASKATVIAGFAIALITLGCGARVHRRAIQSTRDPAEPSIRAYRVGKSVRGRAITAVVVSGPRATENVMIVGCVHGNERAGEAITRYLRTVDPPPDVAWWLIDEFNPDGCAANTRDNANGVDLNRNSPWHWQAGYGRGTIFWSGPAPLSEPESHAIHGLVLKIRPELSVWYHQHAALVDSSSGGSRAIEALYSRLSGLRLWNYGVFPGSITTWQDRTFPSATAFVVELPAGPVSTVALSRHVRAVLAVSGRV